MTTMRADSNEARYDEFELCPQPRNALDGQMELVEPTFTLRGQDLLAPAIVRAWCEVAALVGVPAEKIKEARKIALAMERWRHAKIPD